MKLIKEETVYTIELSRYELQIITDCMNSCEVLTAEESEMIIKLAEVYK
jgi:hypothetical protein